MSETRMAPAEGGQKQITELRVSGHLMTLDTGTFCVFHAPGSAAASDNPLGLPGVRISLPPGPMHHPDEVTISTFRPDGWLGPSDLAALIRVAAGPAQVLITIYQAPGQSAEQAPKLQVLRLNPEASLANAARPAAGAAPQAGPAPDVIVHRQAVGDVGGRIGDWSGERGSRSWIEGFSILPPAPLKPDDLEYQAVLGRGWLSPWVNGGQFCGSRGMALPLLGLRLRLKGDAASRYDCTCHASFTDGTLVGPLPAGAACEAESLAPLEAFQIVIEPNAATRKTMLPAAPRRASLPAAKPAPVQTAAKAKPAIANPPAKPGPTKATAAAPAKPVPKAPSAAAAKRPAGPRRPAR